MTSTDTVTRGPVKKVRPEPVTRTVTRRSTAGDDLGSVNLDPSIFGLEPNLAVLHQVVTAQLAAIRAGTQSTKTRSQVRGGGAKPFAQKGTGRARQGSSRSPSMSGGGIALGPKPRSYRQHTPKKMVRLALLSALSDRAANERVALVDEWGWDGPKTKDAVATLRNLDITGTVLVVLADDETIAGRSFANLPNAKTTSFGQLSAHDVLRSDWILFSDRTLPGTTTPAAGAPAAATTAATAVSAPSADADLVADEPASETVAVDGVTDSDTETQAAAATETAAAAATETEEADTDA
jgi:large subunit ribosomal protein L4